MNMMRGFVASIASVALMSMLVSSVQAVPRALGRCPGSRQSAVPKERLDQLAREIGIFDPTAVGKIFEVPAIESLRDSITITSLLFGVRGVGGTLVGYDVLGAGVIPNPGQQISFPSPVREAQTLGEFKRVEPDAFCRVETRQNGVRVVSRINQAFYDGKALKETFLTAEYDRNNTSQSYQLEGFFDALKNENQANPGLLIIPYMAFITTSDVEIGSTLISKANLYGVGVWQTFVCEDVLSTNPNNLQLTVPGTLSELLYTERGFSIITENVVPPRRFRLRRLP